MDSIDFQGLINCSWQHEQQLQKQQLKKSID